MAASKASGFGRSAITFQPRPNQRNCSWARLGGVAVLVVGDGDLADAALAGAARRVGISPAHGFGSTRGHELGLAAASRQELGAGDGVPIGTRWSRRSQKARGVRGSALAVVADRLAVRSVEERANGVDRLGERE